MGFDEGDILFDSSLGAYYSGQFVNGKLVFDLNSVEKIRAIYVEVKGYCKLHWTTQRSRRRRRNHHTMFYTVTHESQEDYIKMKMYLIGSENTEIYLDPGKHEYDFQFQIPASGPSSFEGSRGHVRYEVKAVVDRPFAIDVEKVRTLRVYAPIDLNRANCNKPVNLEFDQSYCCWCISPGSTKTLVKLPVRGYCPGQVIPVEISCQNRSNVEIDAIKFAITKEITYHAQESPSTTSEEEPILEVQQGPVAGRTDRSWLLEIQLPALDLCNMQHCAFIDIRYQLKVTVSPSGCHTDDDATVELVFGTIPLVGIQDNVPNPLQDKMPQTNIIPQNMISQNYPMGDLRTSTLSFIDSKHDAASMPLLPEGSVPYPISSNPPNPYASASAPAPATPDDSKIPSDIAASNSPYNPDFMNEKKKDEEKNEKN